MNIRLITIGDYLLLPLYLILFYRIAVYYRNKYLLNDAGTAKIFMWAFWLKVVSALMYGFITEYYFKNGDTYLYFEEGSKLFNWILKDGSNIGYALGPAENFEDLKTLYADPDNPHFAGVEGNFMPIRFIALLSFLTFNKYLVISILFSLFSFSGLWKLYQSFTYFYPQLKKELAIAFLFVPSVLFWGSGVMKDPICLGCIGWIFCGVVNIFFKKRHIISYAFIVFVTAFILFLTKSYILVALVISIIFWLAITIKDKIQNSFLKALVLPMLFVVTVVTVYALLNNIQEALGAYALDNFTQNVKASQSNYAASEDAAGGSYFNIGDIDASPAGLLKVAPKVINAAFFRPYVWESKNIMMLFSALESTALMLFFIYTLFKLRFYRLFTTAVSKPLVFQCLMFSIIFGFSVGITTPNFGTLMRYKIPCIPFFIAALVIMLDYEKNRRNKLNAVAATAPPTG